MHYSYSSNLLLSSPVPTAWPDTTKLNSTEIRQFFASRGVLNMFRTSRVELSLVGQWEHSKNCCQPVVTQFSAVAQKRASCYSNTTPTGYKQREQQPDSSSVIASFQ